MNKKLNLSVVGLAIGLCIGGLLTATKAVIPSPGTLTGYSMFGPAIFNLAGETNYVTIQQWPGQTASPFTVVDSNFTELFAVRVSGSIDINNGANQINADGSGTVSSGSITWGANDGSMTISGGNIIINPGGEITAGNFLFQSGLITFNPNDGSATFASANTTISATGNLITADNIEVSADSSHGFICRSPNGSRWLLQVSNLGVVSATAAP